MELKTNVLKIEASGAKEETISELLKQLQENKISFNDLIAEVRKLGGEVTFGEFQIESDNKEKITELLEQFNTGKLNIEAFIKKVREQGDKADFWNWETDMNPKYKDNNKTSVGFRFNPYYHVKGKFMQGVVKTAIKSAINFAHAQIIKHYDRNAFIYDDERLKKIDEYCKRYINENFQNSYPYKSQFMEKAIDILLFIMREDIYYTSRWLDLINGLPRGHELTEQEKANIKKYH